MLDDPRLPDRFWARVSPEPNSGCWLWAGGGWPRGYGAFHHAGRQVKAYRFAYERLVGPIPGGLCIDHLCRTPACVNPAHLEPVPNGENVRRGRSFSTKNRERAVCAQGHPFDATVRRGEEGRKRVCRECARAAATKYNRKRRKR